MFEMILIFFNIVSTKHNNKVPVFDFSFLFMAVDFMIE